MISRQTQAGPAGPSRGQGSPCASFGFSLQDVPVSALRPQYGPLPMH
jgi:hypothetical protein